MTNKERREQVKRGKELKRRLEELRKDIRDEARIVMERVKKESEWVNVELVVDDPNMTDDLLISLIIRNAENQL